MKFYISLIGLLLVAACHPKSRYLQAGDLKDWEGAGAEKKDCVNQEHYIPDANAPELTPMRFIRVNFHILQRGDGTGNFQEAEAQTYIRDLLVYSNRTLLEGNMKMMLPVGNETPALPQRYQYVLTPDGNNPDDDGIYFHQDDELYFMIKKGPGRNYPSRTVVEKYGIKTDSILNIFLLEHHKDSLASDKYNPIAFGVAVGTAVKIRGFWTDHNPPKNEDAWFKQKLLHHEIGHVLGLAHSWVQHDRCEDTPPHPNCWNVGEGGSEGGKNCEVISSNVMDYNIHMSSWTPCQLGIIHKKFSTLDSRQRKLLRKDWCELDTTKNIHIQGEQHWLGAKDLQGHLILKKGAVLHLNCRVSLPRDAQVIVAPGAELRIGKYGYLHNDCGETWDGILIQEKKGQVGQVLAVDVASIRDCRKSPEKTKVREPQKD